MNSYEDMTDTPDNNGINPEIAKDNESDQMMTNENFHPVN